MILSDRTIKEYIAKGKIQIFPEFHLANVRPTGLRLHLGSELLVPVEGQTVDLESPEELQFNRLSIAEEPYILRPGQFILGSTFEKFLVPRDIVCHVDGRSTVASV